MQKKPILGTKPLGEQLKEKIPPEVNFTNYPVKYNNRIFTREDPTYSMPHMAYSWAFNYKKPVALAKKQPINVGMEEYMLGFNDALGKVFNGYPRKNVPQEKVDDLKMTSDTIQLLNDNRGFAEAIMLVFNNEQGYGVDSGGGPTKFGISKTYNSDLDIPNITINEAIERYYRKYWSPDKNVNKIHYKPLQIAYFDDVAGPAGPGGAQSIFENFIVKNFGTDDIQEGIAMMNSFLEIANTSSKMEIYKAYSKERRDYYMSPKRKHGDKYRDGWVKRIDKTTDFINTYYSSLWQ